MGERDALQCSVCEYQLLVLGVMECNTTHWTCPWVLLFCEHNTSSELPFQHTHTHSLSHTHSFTHTHAHTHTHTLTHSLTHRALMGRLLAPLQGKIEEWKKTTTHFDREHEKGEADPLHLSLLQSRIISQRHIHTMRMHRTSRLLCVQARYYVWCVNSASFAVSTALEN